MPPENPTRRGSAPFVVIEEGEDYTSYINEIRAYKEKLVAKWRWFLEGDKLGLPPISKHLWEAMAILFENQQASSMGLLTEATLTTDVALPQKYALPVIRKVYPQLIVSRIASVQPMPLMSGGVAKVFYQDFLREDVVPRTSLTILDSDYSISGENLVPKRVKMTITSETVTAIKDMLAATWSTEVQEDARGALGIDVEAELIQQISDEILREIDQRCLWEILTGAAAGNVNWSQAVPAGLSAKDHYETLGHAFIDAEDLIYGLRYREAEWIVGGRTVTKFIRKMQDFVPAPRNQPGDEPFAMGVRLFGTVTGFWDVYTTVFMPTNKAIMGVYPRSQTDTGYIYAPYIPLAPMPLIYAEFDPTTGVYMNTDKWSRNVRTRYGKKLVVGDLYATVTVVA